MATEQKHCSMGPSKQHEGLQSTVGAPGHLKPVREAKKPVTEMSEVMEQSLPWIMQKGGQAEERITQRLGSNRDLWLPPVPIQRGSSQEAKLPLVTRKGNPEERKLPPIVQLATSSDASCPKLQLSPGALEQSSFDPCPAEVVFRHYIPHAFYEAPLVLRNKGRVPQWVKVTLESYPYFRLVGPKDMCQKAVPGVASTYRILFTPRITRAWEWSVRAEFLDGVSGGHKGSSPSMVLSSSGLPDALPRLRCDTERIG